jgi:hypothetical protein
MHVQIRLNAILILPPGFFQPFSLFGGRRAERRRRSRRGGDLPPAPSLMYSVRCSVRLDRPALPIVSGG